MAVYFDTLNRVRIPQSGIFRVPRGDSSIVPPKTCSLLKAIVLFASNREMPFIPLSTIRELKDKQSLFRYCFCVLMGANHSETYVSGPEGRAIRMRLVALLMDPKQMSPKDLFFGIKAYLNSFIGFMPGGGYRAMIDGQLKKARAYDDRITTQEQRETHLAETRTVELNRPLREIIENVDTDLGLRRLWETAERLKAEADKETSMRPDEFIARRRYAILCLSIFEDMVRLGMRPNRLTM